MRIFFPLLVLVTILFERISTGDAQALSFSLVAVVAFFALMIELFPSKGRRL